MMDKSTCLNAKYSSTAGNHKNEHSGVAIPVKVSLDGIRKVSWGGWMCIDCGHSHGIGKQGVNGVMIEVDSEKDTNDGICVTLREDLTVYAVWVEQYQCYMAVRKLTPKECFRLQGWTDDYFDKAQFVNSDSQLYKQAGNGVTVNAVEAIGKKIRNM